MKRIYYVPNGGISFLPDIAGTGDFKVFGCRTPEEYDNGKIVFWNTPNAAEVFKNEICAFAPDVVWIETVSVQMVAALMGTRAKYRAPIVCFWGDAVVNEYELDLLAHVGRYCDMVLVIEKPTEAALRALGINSQFVLQPAAASIYVQEPSAVKVYDVVMAANPHPEHPGGMARIDLARRLAQTPGFVLFGGAEWSKFGLDTTGWLDEYELARTYNRTKIAVSSDAVIDSQYFTSVRTYNVLCCGAFLLIRRFRGVEDLFVNRKHLVWFDTIDEAEGLIDYYLEHEDERQAIADEGMKYVHETALKRNLFEHWINQDYPRWRPTSWLMPLLDRFWLRRHQPSR